MALTIEPPDISFGHAQIRRVLTTAYESGCECDTCELVRSLSESEKIALADPERITRMEPWRAARWAVAALALVMLVLMVLMAFALEYDWLTLVFPDDGE